MRARMIELGSRGLSHRKIAEYVDYVPTTVGNWISRWIDNPPKKKRDLKAWLEDRPRCEAPCRPQYRPTRSSDRAGLRIARGSRVAHRDLDLRGASASGHR